jgi:Tol biopolymer transport system component/tRNA A-37 threonylcarbamoyl transferase component Bud32
VTTFDRLAAALGDRYRIERELGQGGMATVYLAHDLRHHRKVALKVLKPELAAMLGAERFVVEIRTTAALQHPHILPLFDSGTADGFLYYVMPFIDGETLRSKLDRETQLGIDEAVKLTVAVADALDYAHRHGVIHRDIKPENILLHDGRPMVADFGIALALSAAAGGRMTETGLSLGTPHYMSPEQATAEKELSPRSDIYSLGSVLYEMLTGNPPHTGASAQQIIMKIVTEEAAPVTRLRKSVPPNVAAAVGKAIEKLPADRFVSAAEFAAALSNPAYVASGGTTRIHALAPLRRYGPARALALACVVLAAVGLWGWLRPVSTGDPASSWRVRIALPDGAPLGEGLSLTSDGSRLVYDAGGRLWLRTAEATNPVPIGGTDGAWAPAFSPDGRRMAFFRGYRVPVLIDVMTLEGGTSRTIVSNASISSGPGWTDDDHIVYSGLAGLVRVPASGGDGQQLTTVDSAAGEVLHVEASGLPGDGGVVFTIMQRNSDSSYIAAVGPEGGRVTRLLPGLRAIPAPPDHLIVTRLDGSIVALPFDAERRRITGAPVSIASGLRTGTFTMVGRTTVSATGRLIYVAAGWGRRQDPADLVWIGRGGALAPVDTSWTALFESVAVSPNGHRVAVAVAGENTEDLFVRDLSSGSEARIAIPGTMLRDPVFSPDGRWLYFLGLGASHGLHRVDPNGTAAPERILPSEFAPIGHLAIAPDGDHAYYLKATAETRRQILRYSLSHGTTDAAVTLVGGTAVRPQVSPDGRWLAFLSLVSRPEVHVRSVDATRLEDWRVASTVDEGTSIRWSRAGDELFYIANDSMMAVRLSPSPSLQVGAPRALFSTAGFRPGFALGPDGSFLMIRWRPAMRPPTELVMLERWADLLPR